jgi:hypothetical protein
MLAFVAGSILIAVPASPTRSTCRRG